MQKNPKIFEDTENEFEKQTSRENCDLIFGQRKKQKEIWSDSLFGKYSFINRDSKLNATDKMKDATIWTLLLKDLQYLSAL